MPWNVSKGHSGCPSDTPYAVVKEADGSVEGCHATQEEADAQVAALYASEGGMAASTAPWEGTLAVEGITTGDGREFAPDSLTWADLPVPLRWNKEDSHGGEPHTVAVNVGRIDKIWRDGHKVMGSGVLNLAEPDGRRAYDMIKGEFLRGVSIDADSIANPDIEYVWPENNAEEATEDDLFAMLFAQPEKVIFHAGRIRAATLVDIPAFAEAYVALTASVAVETFGAVASHSTATSESSWDGPANEARLNSPLSVATARNAYAWIDSDRVEGGEIVKDACRFIHHEVSADGTPGAANLTACSTGIGVLNGGRGGTTIPMADRQGVYDHLARHLRDADRTPPEANFATPVLVAHAAPLWTPPAAWFADPRLSVPTPITVSGEGRIYGHAAQWGECHIGQTGVCVSPPHEVDHPYFMTGSVTLADGTEVSVGQITVGTSHAPLSMGAAPASQHYDHTGWAVADVVVGNDDTGIWVAGGIRPNADASRVHELKAAGQVSGDWRRIGGALRLVGLLAVNVPGFPVPKMRARVASGVQHALVAAGRPSVGMVLSEEEQDQRAMRRVLNLLSARVNPGR